MKKFCFLLICVLILPIFFVGCKEEDPNDGFVEVQSITYVVGDNSTTLNSTWRIKTIPNSTLASSEQEVSLNAIYYTWHPNYDPSYISSAPFFRFTNVFNKNININSNKSNIPTFNNGDIVYYYSSDTYSLVESNDKYCFKTTVKEVELSYINIKVINDNTIEIKSSEGQISRILCTSYKINYFI